MEKLSIKMMFSDKVEVTHFSLNNTVIHQKMEPIHDVVISRNNVKFRGVLVKS